MRKDKKQVYNAPNLQLLGKLKHDTQGGNSSCADGSQSQQQCRSGNN